MILSLISKSRFPGLLEQGTAVGGECRAGAAADLEKEKQLGQRCGRPARRADGSSFRWRNPLAQTVSKTDDCVVVKVLLASIAYAGTKSHAQG